MQILGHSQIAAPKDVYSQVASASTRKALSKLGSRLDSGSVSGPCCCTLLLQVPSETCSGMA